MIAIILVVHLIIAIALVAVVLVQRSEGGGLGIGSGTMGGLMTTRGSANLLTRVTAVLATCFMTTSIVLAILSGGNQTQRSILDQQAPAPQTQPAPPPQPTTPSVPLAN